ncbi:CDK-activating kinase assembly factor, partial [Saccharata proteae CBS 121410]
ESCPVCKSTRYLNSTMVFKINPECYHQMCEGCVDRYFMHGPAPCPIAGCGKTLRKNRFKYKTFEDVQIEREVDIRRTMSQKFNRREDEFESLKAYNNYLNEVEDMTFNLIHNIDVERTQAKIKAYADANRDAIKENVMLASQEATAWEAQQAADAEQAKMRRRAAMREDEELKQARLDGRRDIINKLANSHGNAEQIARDGHKVVLKKPGAQRLPPKATSKTAAAAQAPESDTPSDSGFVIKGLKTRVKAEPEKPFDPYGGDSYVKERFVLQDHYDWPNLNKYKKDTRLQAGGYDFKEYYNQALVEAFGGLTVFIGEDATAQDVGASVATAAAAAGAA